MALQEFGIVSEQLQSLFQLQITEKNPSEEQHPKAMKQSQQLLDSFHTKPLNEKIYQVCTYIHMFAYAYICMYGHLPFDRLKAEHPHTYYIMKQLIIINMHMVVWF